MVWLSVLMGDGDYKDVVSFNGIEKLVRELMQ